MAPMLTAIHGTIADVPDIFVFTMAVDDGDQGQAATAAAQVNAFTTALTVGAPDSLQARIGNNFTFTHATAAEILSLSLGTLAAASRADFDPAITGTSINNPPAQVSCCVSWTGGNYANGTPIRGRSYLPGVQTATDTGLYASTTQATVANAIGQWVTQLNDFGLVVPSVWSRKLAALSPISAARVGRIPDTIRSRRNGGAENYVDVVISP